jgi:multiple sugar transport system permease protein/sorbitol/mannitol transport system permease protein
VKARWTAVVADVATVLVAFIFAAPILWLVLTAFKPNDLSETVPPRWLVRPTLANFRYVLGKGNASSEPFLEMLKHSVEITVISGVLVLLVSLMASFAITRTELPQKENWAMWLLSTRILPPAVAVFPVFMVASHFNMLDTVWVLAIPYAVFNVPLTIWILRSFMVAIPKEIDEAATVDGAGLWYILWRIVVPLVRPGIAAAGVIATLLSWNELLFATVLTSDYAKPASVGVIEFINAYGLNWGYMAAASLIILVPVATLTIVARANIIEGLSLGAVKG